MGDPATPEDGGRFRQRRRTRAAIVAAAGRLLAKGHSNPSMSEIADEADVSRRTVYLYFPTVEQLLVDATLGALSQAAVDEAIANAGADASASDAAAEARVTAMIDALVEQSAQTLPLGRSLIKLTVDGGGEPDPARPVRGYRRIGWIEQATAPLRARLGDDAYARLVSGLAMVVGWEAMIVLGDLRGLRLDEQQETMVWAARALISAALAEARPA